MSLAQVSEAFNYVESAKVNLKSLALQVPVLKQHPYFKIVEFQIEEAANILSGRDTRREPEQLEFGFGADRGKAQTYGE